MFTKLKSPKKPEFSHYYKQAFTGPQDLILRVLLKAD
jgi:hypothetical protein